MITTSRHPHRPALQDRFFGKSLPLDFGLRPAARLYLRRLLILLAAAAAVLVAGILFALVGPVSAAAAILAILALTTAPSLMARGGKVSHTGRNRDLLRRLTALLFLLFAIIAAALAGLTIANSGEWRSEMLLLALVAMIGAGAIGSIQARIARATTYEWTEELRAAVAAARTFQSMTTVLGDVATSRTDAERRASVDLLIAKAVGLVKVMSGRSGAKHSRTRGLYYHLESDGRLVRWAYEGEYGDPRIDFYAERSENDRRVVELAKGDTVLFVNDLDEAPPRYFSRPSDRAYKSLISVPVQAGGKPFGILMVDAEEADGLTDVDIGYAMQIAGMLGAGLAAASTQDLAQETGSPDITYIDDFASSHNSVFAETSATTATSFKLLPDEDRQFLSGAISVQDYYSSVSSLAESRARRRLNELQRSVSWLPRVVRYFTAVGELPAKDRRAESRPVAG